jgi:hypothetical protein
VNTQEDAAHVHILNNYRLMFEDIVGLSRLIESLYGEAK